MGDDLRKSVSKSTKAHRASILASESTKKKVTEAKSVSDFVKNAREDIMLQMAALRASLVLLDALADMSDEDKLDLLFELLDKDGDGAIDAKELADGIRKRNQDLNFAESLDRAIDMVALFDKDRNAKLDKEEFKECIDTMLAAMDSTFHEFSEFIIFQMIFLEGNDYVEEIVSDIAAPEIEEEVKARGEYYAALVDPRMVALFQLFDLDHDGTVDYVEVVLGLYTITGDLEGAEQMAVSCLLMFDEDDNRTLDYTEFAKLIMNIAAASDNKFEDIADSLTLAMCQEKTVTKEQVEDLMVKDAEFNAALDVAEEVEDVLMAAGALQYTRLLKLFDLWDTDHNGTIDFAELLVAMRKFHGAMDIEESVARAALTMLGFDQDGDQKLDPGEFALAMVKYAKALEVPIPEFVDFMIVASTLEDNDVEEEAYLKAIAPEVSSEIGKIQQKIAKLALEEGVAE